MVQFRLKVKRDGEFDMRVTFAILAVLSGSAFALNAQDGDKPAAPAGSSLADHGRLTQETGSARVTDVDVMREQAEIENETSGGDASPDRQDGRANPSGRPVGLERPANPQLGGGDPGWEVRQADQDGADNPQLGGGDPGWEVQTAPQSEAENGARTPVRQSRPSPRSPRNPHPARTTPNRD